MNNDTFIVSPNATYQFAQYDAVVPRDKRRTPSTNLTAEDIVLNRGKRASLVGGARDLHRNFAVCRWIINHHLDNVATFTFQATTGNLDVDARIEELMRWYQRPENCDVAGRHSFNRIVRLLEERRVIDGDVFLLKLRDGRLQAIEGDRVRDPEGPGVNGGNDEKVIQGVRISRNGRPLAYAVHRRAEGLRAGYEFDRYVRAGTVLHHGWFDRFDQVRGISPLAAAYNTMQDLYEALDQTLLKIKVAAMFGLVLYREAAEQPVATTEAETDGGYSIDFGRGPVLLDLDPGDRAEFLENKTPSTEFREFVSTLIDVALKSLQIPMSAYDPSVTNYSGARQALLAYEQSCEFRRHELQTILDNITAWRLRMFIESGELLLPEGMSPETLRWEWRPRPMPWIDPLKETQAYREQIAAGLNSRQEICKRHGRDFWEVTMQLSDEQVARYDAGLIDPEQALMVDAGDEEQDDE